MMPSLPQTRSLRASLGSVLLGLFFMLPAGSVPGQGSLTPPGGPAPNLKSLAEIEPRLAVQSLAGDANAQYVIAQPGSYFLTGSIAGVAGKSAIAIAAGGVTLDLAGFALVGVAGSGLGIEVRGVVNQVVIRDGQIRGFPSGGVVSSSPVSNFQLHRVQIASSTAGPGISLIPGGNVLVADCSVSEVSGQGGILIAANRGKVDRCQVTNCTPTGGFTGISAQSILASEVNTVSGGGSGQIFGLTGTVVTDSNATSLTQSGSGAVTAISGSTVRGCSVDGVTAGSSGATGINSTVIESCAVANIVASGAGAATGLAGQTVTGSRVQLVNLGFGAGAGTATGILGQTVHGCQASGVGGPASANGITGISATLISHSSVDSIGSPPAGSNVTGLKAPTVLHSHVHTLLGGSSGVTTGIAGSKVSDCTVTNLSTIAGSTASLRGIEAEQIYDCRITNLTANGSGVLYGIYAYRIARHCQITGLGGTTVGRFGGSTGFPGRTEAVSVAGNLGIGLSVLDTHTVIGCTVEGAVFGIAANGRGNVIESNNIVGPSTRGIYIGNGLNTAAALVVRNQIRGATTAILAEAPAQVGPIVSAAGTLAAGTNSLGRVGRERA